LGPPEPARLSNLVADPRHRRLVAVGLLLVLLTSLYVFKIRHYMVDIDVDLVAGRRFIAGEMLYRTTDGHYQFKYSPASAMFISPLASLPRPVARAVVYYAVAATLLALLFLSGRILSDEKLPTRLYVLTFLVQVKFYGRELELGQVNAVMVLLLMLMLLHMKRGRDVLAGALLALAAVIKPYPLVFLPWLVLRRKFTVVAVAVAVHLVTAVLPVLRYGVSGSLELYHAWYTTLSLSTPSQLGTIDNVSLFGLLAKWFGDNMPGLKLIAFGIAAVLYLALLAATVSRPRHEFRATAAEGSVLLIFMPLFSPLGWDYIFLSSTLGVMLLLHAWPELGRWRRAALVTLLVLVGASIYDLLGVRLYTWFMDAAVLTPCFVGLIVMLLWVRIRHPDTGEVVAT
jgi:hypothetical protein